MYATTLDLKMGYYTIRLDPTAQHVCTIITPFRKFAYTRLPMGLSCAPDIFQREISCLMQGMEFVRTYLDDLLVLSTKSYDDHLTNLTEFLQRLSNEGLRVGIDK